MGCHPVCRINLLGQVAKKPEVVWYEYAKASQATASGHGQFHAPQTLNGGCPNVWSYLHIYMAIVGYACCHASLVYLSKWWCLSGSPVSIFSQCCICCFSRSGCLCCTRFQGWCSVVGWCWPKPLLSSVWSRDAVIGWLMCFWAQVALWFIAVTCSQALNSLRTDEPVLEQSSYEGSLWLY